MRDIMTIVISRTAAAANALGSTRAEGLEPSEEALLTLSRWTRGEIDDAELERIEQSIVDAASLFS